MHNLQAVHWSDSMPGDNALLTASFEGVHLFELQSSGVRRMRLGSGDTKGPAPAPRLE